LFVAEAIVADVCELRDLGAAHRVEGPAEEVVLGVDRLKQGANLNAHF